MQEDVFLWKAYESYQVDESVSSLWTVFSRIRTESTILLLYRRIQSVKNPFSRLFYAKEMIALRFGI